MNESKPTLNEYVLISFVKLSIVTSIVIFDSNLIVF